MILEDPVILDDTLFEQTFAARYIRDSLTKRLSRLGRGPRCVTDPLNPSHIIFSCEDRSAIFDEGELSLIVASLLNNVDPQWYNKQSELDRARTVPRPIVRTTDGEGEGQNTAEYYRDVRNRVIEGTSAAINSNTHNPTYTEDEVAVTNRVYTGEAATENESDSDDKLSFLFCVPLSFPECR